MEVNNEKARKRADKKLLKRCKDKGILEEWISKKKVISSWKSFEEIVELIEANSKTGEREVWLYRGEDSWRKNIKSSIEKAMERYHYKLSDLYETKIEQGIIRRFKRDFIRMPHFQPRDDDHMAWLAIMRHHGAPTRLIDITFSAYTALFFALNEYEPDTEAAIWCFNKKWLDNGWNEKATRKYHIEYARDIEARRLELFNLVLKCTNPSVYIINPYNPPDRLVLQQGGFLLPLDIKLPFMENLYNMSLNPLANKKVIKYEHRIIKLKIKLDEKELENVRYHLIRMNINSSTLFPGIDGFSRSLFEYLPFEELRTAFKPGF